MKLSTPVYPVLLSLFGIADLVGGAKFYPYGNPCTTDPMYYEDAADVLLDLSSFKALYIKYEGCAYSKRTDIYSDDANSGNDAWYLGFNFKQGANVAYSLYGEKEGVGGRRCSKKTFIGSFYSLTGLSSFATAAGIDTSSLYSYGSGYKDLSDGNNNNNNNNNNRNSNNIYQNGNVQGLYCNPATKEFEEAVFSDRSMNPQYFTTSLDSLTSLNKAFSKTSCVQIYDASTGLNYASDLLFYSDSCSLMDGSQCPDRYGKLAECELKFTKTDTLLQAPARTFNLDATGIRYLVGGLLYVFAALGILLKFKMQKDPDFIDDVCRRPSRKSKAFEVDETKKRSRKSKSPSRKKKSKSKNRRTSEMDNIRNEDQEFVVPS